MIDSVDHTYNIILSLVCYSHERCRDIQTMRILGAFPRQFGKGECLVRLISSRNYRKWLETQGIKVLHSSSIELSLRPLDLTSLLRRAASFNSRSFCSLECFDGS
jgi:hypothetical protein